MTESVDRREYPNPPIEEALVQITFAEPLSWNVATPGLLDERLRDAYPREPAAQEQLQAEVHIPGAGQAGPNFALNRGPQRFVYRDDTEHRLLVASPLTLSANSLRPYEGWPALNDRFRAAAELLNEVAPLKPVQRVTLRYINRVRIPGPQVDTDDYFYLTVRTADSGRASFRGFMHRVESILEDDQTVVVSTFASLQPDADSGTLDFLLDLEVYRDGLNLGDIGEMIDVAGQLKVIENAEFESSIRDAARELFQ